MTEEMNARAKLICMRAYRNEPTAERDGWDLSDLKLYHAMRLIYAEYGMLILSREEALSARQEVIAAWEREKGEAT